MGERLSSVILLNMALLVLMRAPFAQGIKSKDDDDKDDGADVLEAIGALVDLLTIIGWVFAGGPEEVLGRLCAIGALVLFTVAVAMCLALCGCEPSKRKASRFEKGAMWGVRGVNAYSVASEYNHNAHKWQ